MRDGLNLALMVASKTLIEQQRGAVLPLEELLQGENLAAITERVSGEHA